MFQVFKIIVISPPPKKKKNVEESSAKKMSPFHISPPLFLLGGVDQAGTGEVV